MNLNRHRRVFDLWEAKKIHGDVLVLFDDIESELIELIKISTKIVGCVAWFTSPAVLRALVDKKVSIIVQKDPMFYPRSPKAKAISTNIKRLYQAITTRLTVNQSTPYFEDIFADGSQLVDPFRLYGTIPKKSANAPRMHHKFLIFDDRIVWTGSFNITNNATESLENVLVIKNEAVAKSYLKEYTSLLSGSMPLSWYSRTILKVAKEKSEKIKD